MVAAAKPSAACMSSAVISRAPWMDCEAGWEGSRLGRGSGVQTEQGLVGPGLGLSVHNWPGSYYARDIKINFSNECGNEIGHFYWHGNLQGQEHRERAGRGREKTHKHNVNMPA